MPVRRSHSDKHLLPSSLLPLSFSWFYSINIKYGGIWFRWVWLFISCFPDRLHQIKCAVVAVSILVHLISPPYTLHSPSSPSILTSLTSLLTRCLGAATSAACVVATLNKDRKTSVPPAAGAAGGGEEEKEVTEGQQTMSIPELLSVISYCRTPSPVSTVTARTLAHDIAVLTVSSLSPLAH